jgi:hypothetical protein
MNPKMIPTTKIMDYRNTGKSVFEKKCQYENCGNTFYPVRKDAKFCSNSCRCRYNAELKAEKIVITTNSKGIKANITELAAHLPPNDDYSTHEAIMAIPDDILFDVAMIEFHKIGAESLKAEGKAEAYELKKAKTAKKYSRK